MKPIRLVTAALAGLLLAGCAAAAREPPPATPRAPPPADILGGMGTERLYSGTGDDRLDDETVMGGGSRHEDGDRETRGYAP